MLEIIVGLVIILFGAVTVVLPWINRSRIAKLKAEVDRLNREVDDLIHQIEGQPAASRAQTAAAASPPDPVVTSPYKEFSASDKGSVMEDDILDQAAFAIQSKPRPQSHDRSKPEPKKLSFEQQFGARLPVWIGGIALILAGFYMVKYSIDAGLLSPWVRVLMGLVFGAGLIFAADRVRKHPSFADGQRISQSMAGAGIGVLYGCIFAASGLYQLIPPLLGFVGMAGVTAGAVLLSLQYGMPIALLGLLGGFVTPALIQSGDPQAYKLFSYLYLVLAGLMFVIRKRAWWGLAIPAVLGAFIWVALWLFSGKFHASDSVWLGLFLIATCATVTGASKDAFAGDGVMVDAKTKPKSLLNIITLGGAVALMAIVAVRADFGLLEWGLYGLLSAGGIGLAFYNQRLYGLAPWLTMIVNAVMLIAWQPSSPVLFAGVLVAYALLYALSGYCLQLRSEKPLRWAGLTAAASVGYYLIGYFEFRHSLFVADLPLFVADLPLFWGLLALVLSGAAIGALQEVMRLTKSHPQRQHLMAVYAGLSTAFLSLAMTIELPREFLSVAFAFEVLALAWINTRVEINALRWFVGALGAVFAFLLFPQILLLVQLAFFGLFESTLPLSKGVPIIDWPLFQLGVPAVCFLGGSILLRRQKDDRLVRVLEAATIALVGVMGYYLMRHAFHADEQVLFTKVGFVERGAITNVLFVFGLSCLWLGRRFGRSVASAGGLLLAAIATFRIGYFDLFVHNPAFASSQHVGETPIFNALLLTYGLPILWLVQLRRDLIALGKDAWAARAGAGILVLAFALVTLQVRQVFHGDVLSLPEITNAEIYTYSAVWLVLGIGLLLLGTMRRDKMIRIASLGVMILTVGKVFLYDASELEGLLRVFSFLGLGLSLLGLSWFYTRYVFGSRGEESE